jgi:polygalacturonase
MDNVLKGALCFKGERGYSAYEIAVQNGFQGNKEAWLEQIGYEEINAKLPANIKDFGAVGDGVTDDTEALQAAINCENVDKLYFPSGTYLINKTINLRSNIKLYGEGVIKIAGRATTTDMIRIDGLNNIVIDGLKFETTLNNADASEFNRSTSVLWSNMIGFHITNANNISIINSDFTNFEYALKVDGDSNFNNNVIVENCKINNSPMPIYVSYTDNFTVRNCRIDATEYASGYDHHIYGSAYCKNHIIESCEFINGGGLPIHYSDNYDNDNVEGVYHAVNIIVSNVSLINTFGGIFVDRNNSYMSVSNISIHSSRTYDNGLFRANGNAKLTVNGINIDAENAILTSSKDGGDSLINICSGYANVQNVALGTFDSGNELILKNITLEVKDNIIYHGSNSANYVIENCTIYYVDTAENSGYPLSIRNADSSMYFVNNTTICKDANGSYFIYNGATDVCENFIFANNVIKGFSTLVHSDATLVKEHNNYKV